MATTNDITKTGPQSFRDIQRQNAEAYNNIPQDDYFADLKPLRNYVSSTSNIYEGLESSPIQQQGGGDYFGRSQYDNPNITEEEFSSGSLNDIRYENQPWYDVLANGVGKMLGTAGTTFLSSLVALPYGLASAAMNGDPSKLWNNDITKVLGDVDDWLESSMTNYQSEEQKQAKWWQRLGDMNWWADDVIKNMGFTMGAAASGALGAGALGLLGRTMGVVNNVSKGSRIANNIASALFSATGEGMIEARQGVEERNKLETQRLEDALAPQYNALDMEMQLAEQEYQQNRGLNLVADPTTGRPVDAAYLQYRQKIADIDARRRTLDSQKQAGIQQIEDTGAEMGNKILLGNQVLLTAGNLIQFGKLFSKSFDNARHMAEITAKTNKPLIAGASRVSEDIAQGYKTYGKRAGQIAAGTKGILTEGSEEMNQQWIQNSAGYSVNREDVNDYWKAKLDPKAYKDTTQSMYNLGEVISQGFKDSWGDIDQWEQFVIGGFTGAAGIYMPTKIFNQDTSKSRLNPLRYGEWAGGAVNEIRDYNERFNQYQENIDDLNKVVARADFPTRLQDYTAHTALQKNKEYAALADDKKLWKDEDDKQTVHDIQAFLRAGKLDDLRAMYNEMGRDLSDAEVDEIIKSTTYHISAEEDKRNHDANIDRQIAEKQQHIKGLSDWLNSVSQNAEAFEEGDLEATRQQIADEQAEIASLEEQKKDYLGKRTFIGAYVDENGNKASYDEVRAAIKHNAEELNRKLDSYLDSAAVVNEMSRGRLNKDQEDNLTYLHNISKEKVERFNKIMAGVRNQLPSTFLLKTEKTHEQLASQYASSDLTFEKNENTEKGYVEVDLSRMNDANFGNFFMREVMWGVDKNQEEDAKEQRKINWDTINDNFKKNYKPQNTGVDVNTALVNMQTDIIEASQLLGDSYDFYNTFMEYMENPEKVEQAKEEEATRQQEENLKSKYNTKKPSDINKDINNGTASFQELSDFIDVMEANNNRSEEEEENLQNAKTAKSISEEARNIKSSITRTAQEMVDNGMSFDDVQRAVESVNQMVDDVAINTDDLAAFDQMLRDESALRDNGMSDITFDLVAKALEDKQAGEHKRADIPDARQQTPGEPNETGNDAVTKVPGDTAVPEQTKRSEVTITPFAHTMIDRIADDMRKIDDTPSQAGTWRSTTTRYKYHSSTEPYHEVARRVYGADSIEYKRSKAIHNYLLTNRAYEAVENADAPAIKERDTIIHFMVKDFSQEIYDKPYGELTEEQKPAALVILMLDDNGRILGDLPFANWEPSIKNNNPTRDASQLKALQDKIFKAFDENKIKTSATEAIVDSTLTKDGAVNLDMKYKNGNPLVSRVQQVMAGVVPFVKNEINSLNDIAGGEKFFIGVDIGNGNIIGAQKGQNNPFSNKIRRVNVGKAGNPYLLLPSVTGELIPVPFYTPAFDIRQHRKTQFFSTLTDAIQALMGSNDSAVYRKNMDVIQGLIQVKAQEGVKRVLEDNGSNVTLHLQSLLDGNNKIDVTVQKTANQREIAEALAERLSGIPINISLQYINRDITPDVDYNTLIGEIANANLPKNTRHTVNSWFTVALATDAGMQAGSRIAAERQVTPFTTTINGRMVTIDPSTYTATDETGREILDDEDVALALAEVKASKQEDKTKNFKIQIGGDVRTYNPVEKKFVKTTAPTTVRTEQKEEPKSEETKKVTLFFDDVKEAPKKKEAPVNKIEPKTAEQIDNELREQGIIDSTNDTAWNTVPAELKEKAVNNGVGIDLVYGNTRVSVYFSNQAKLKKALTDANRAARGKNLVVEESARKSTAEVDNTIENQAAARKWLAKNLPGLSSEERLQFVTKLAYAGDDKQQVWGTYKNGAIQILENAPMGTTYHEAFHYVMDMLLDSNQRIQILDAAREKYGNMNDMQLEERLAEDFRRFMLDEEAEGIIGRLKRLFKRLKDLIMRFNKIDDLTINSIFKQINDGSFAAASKASEPYSKYTERIAKEAHDARQERISWKNLSADQRSALKESGLSEEKYNRFSLSEQEQWLKCRT